MKTSEKFFDIVWQAMKGLCVSFYIGDLPRVKLYANKITKNLELLLQFMEKGE